MNHSLRKCGRASGVIAILCAASLAVVPAASAGPVTKGALQGAGIGAIAATVSGGDPLKGAAAGAATGAVIGAVKKNKRKKKKKK